MENMWLVFFCSLYFAKAIDASCNGLVFDASMPRSDTLQNDASCPEGYVMTGFFTIVCINETWINTPNCRLIVCGNPPTLANMKMFAPTSGPYTAVLNNVVTYTCDNGYKINGDDSIVCQNNGTWSTAPTCAKITCGPPPEIDNMKSFGPAVSNFIATYSCLNGYKLSGPSNITCQHHGVWGTPPFCEKIVCGVPPNVPNMQGFLPANGIYTPISNNNVTYACATGYQLHGPNTIVCQFSGNWTLPPTCEVVVCDNPPFIKNVGSFAPLVGPYTAVLNNFVMYSCAIGYKIFGPSNITCQANGTWTSAPICAPIFCENPPNVTNSNILSSSSAPYSFLSSSSVSYSCKPGYKMVGSGAITCSVNGSWTTAPECNVIECASPPAVNNMKGYTPNTGPYTALWNNVVTYACADGYTLMWSGIITCQESGYWTAHTTCEKIGFHIHEFTQHFASPSPPIKSHLLYKKLSEDLNRGFKSESLDVQTVSLKNIYGDSTVRYWVRFFGYQPPSVFVTTWQDFLESDQAEGVILLGSPRTAFCRRQNFGGFSFPEVPIHWLSYSAENCPQGYSQASLRCILRSERKFGSDIHYALFDNTSLTSISCDVQVSDIEVNSVNVTQEDVEKAARSLQIITSQAHINETEALESLKVVDSITKAVEEGKAQVTEEVLINVATVVSAVSRSLATKTKTESQTSNRENILNMLSFFAKQVQFENDTDSVLEMETESISIKVTERERAENHADTWFAPEVNVQSVVPVNISVPGSVLSHAQSKVNGSTLKTVFFLHRGASLFLSNHKVDFVATVEIGDARSLTDLHPPVTLKHRNEQTKHWEKIPFEKLTLKRIRQQCAYWDFKSSDWKTDGCCLDNTAHPPVCKCDHLTNFALLVSTSEVPEDVVLSTVSDVGCGLSLLGFVATLLLHVINKDQLRKVPNQIQLHICVNLLIAYLVFLFGVARVENPQACTAVAAVMQYTFLTSWLWMAVYSNKLYTALVKVFNVANTNYMIKACFFSYGLPVLVVGFNLGLSLEHFDKQLTNEDVCQKDDPRFVLSTYRAENMCWLHRFSLYMGFLLVVGIVYVNNVVILVLVLKTVFKRKQIQSTAAKRGKRQQVIMACSLSFSLGLTWIFGFLMLISTDPTYNHVMNYLFSLFNAFQGVFLFYITCVKRKDMFLFWWLPIRKRLGGCWRRVQGTTGANTSSYSPSGPTTFAGRPGVSTTYSGSQTQE